MKQFVNLNVQINNPETFDIEFHSAFRQNDDLLVFWKAKVREGCKDQTHRTLKLEIMLDVEGDDELDVQHFMVDKRQGVQCESFVTAVQEIDIHFLTEKLPAVRCCSFLKRESVSITPPGTGTIANLQRLGGSIYSWITGAQANKEDVKKPEHCAQP